jgi:dynein heavy chain 1, cytosolic
VNTIYTLVKTTSASYAATSDTNTGTLTLFMLPLLFILQLPAEFSRFKVVDGEFIQLMRKVTARPAILEVLSIDGLLQQLERQAGLMSKVQKALGEHLERQRAAFSRFYFVGDEDLLEIIGGGAEPAKAVRHLGKMFASIGSVTLSTTAATSSADGSTAEAAAAPLLALAMVSKDAEVTRLLTPVKVGGQGVKDWLAALEIEMRATLSALLVQAVKAAPYSSSSGSSSSSSRADAEDAFAQWCSEYPAQVVTLACQVRLITAD